MTTKKKNSGKKKHSFSKTKLKNSILENKELFRLITEHVDDLIAVIDINGNRLYHSPSYRKILEDASFSPGVDSFQEIHPDDRDRVRKIFEDSITAGVGKRTEYRFLLKDGSIRYIESQGNVICDTEGKPTQLVVVSRDITERKISEKAHRLLAYALSCTKDCFCLTDLDNNFLFVNQAFCQTYGYTEEELLGKNVSLIRPSDTTSSLGEDITELTMKGGWNGEIFNKRKDGSKFKVELWTSVVYDEANKPTALVGVARDITDRDRIERLQKAVYQISQAADKSQNLEELFKELHEIIETVMPAKNFYIALYDEKEGLLSFPYFVDEIDVPFPPQKLGRGLTEYVLRTGTSLLCTKEMDEELQRKGEVELVGVPSPIWLGVPLIVEQKAIGVMTVQHYADPKAYGTNEQQVLEFVSSQVAKAIYRKRAEKALRESEERYRTVAETASDAIISIDHKSTILFVNSAAEKIFGYTVSELLGQKITMLMPEYLRYVHSASLSNYVSTGKKHITWTGVELPGLHKTGTEIPLELSFGEFIRDGQHIFTGIVRDITERKRIESSLRESEARLRSLVTNAPVVLFAVDRDGVFTLSDGKGLAALGLKSGENVGRSVFDQYRDIPEVLNAVRRALSGEPLTASIGIQGVYFETHFSPVYDQDGAVSGVIGVAVDITERHRAEQVQTAVYRLAEAADRSTSLEELFKDVHAIILTVMPAKNFYIALADDDDDEKITFPYFVDEVDVPPDPQTRGKGLTEYVLRTGKALLCDKARDEELQRRGEVEEAGVSASIWLGVPLIIQNKTIGVMTVQHYSDASAYGARELHILEFVSSQIAKAIDKKRSEEALRQSEEKYRTLFEESKDGIFLSTPEGHLIDVNPAGVDLFGHSSKDELLKMNIANDLYYNASDRQLFIEKIASQGFVTDFEFEIKTLQGERKVVIESASAIRNKDGEVLAYRGFLRDITERKKLEDQLRHAQKMETIGTFAGGIAHDFNNLLGIILGYTSLLEDPSLDAKGIAQNVQTIKKAVERGAALVRQLLTFARKSETRFESVNANETVSELAKMLTQTFPKSISISMDLGTNLPSIVADADQLHQALLNLCVNSRDSMLDRAKLGPFEGSLILGTRLAEAEELHEKFPETTADECLVISIRDNGMGMNKETRGRIFEPFFTTKELGKGTGLGLSVVYGVVNNHHGFVDVESEPGKGTTFFIYLPVQDHRVIRTQVIDDGTKEVPAGTETILVVEDEEMLLDLVTSVLEERGYSVLAAKDGQEGIEIYRQRHQDIACVLTDMGLPRLGGWEMFMKMRECNPGVRAILASGYCDPKIRAEMINEGAKDFIQKPYVSEIVLKRIREIIDAAS